MLYYSMNTIWGTSDFFLSKQTASGQTKADVQNKGKGKEQCCPEPQQGFYIIFKLPLEVPCHIKEHLTFFFPLIEVLFFFFFLLSFPLQFLTAFQVSRGNIWSKRSCKRMQKNCIIVLWPATLGLSTMQVTVFHFVYLKFISSFFFISFKVMIHFLTLW